MYPLPIPYHDVLFERLAERPELDLTVLFCRQRQVGRDWKPRSLRYPHVFMRNFGYAFQRQDLHTWHVNPGVVAHLTRGHYHLVAINGLNHATMLMSAMYARLTGTPYLVWNESHHRRIHSPSLLRRAVKAAVYRPVVSGAAAALVTGSYAAEYMVSYGAREERIFVVANTCDPQPLAQQVDRWRQERPQLRRDWSIPEDAFVLLYVGRLVRTKGLHVLLEASRRVKEGGQEPWLLLVGGGPLHAELESQASSLGLDRVRFLGFLDVEELPRAYAAADAFVLPSLDEPWGTVVNEAASAGLPLLVSGVAGAAGDLVVDGRNGFRLPAGDHQVWAEAIRNIMQLPESQRRTMGQASRELMRGWTYEVSVENFVTAAKLATRPLSTTVRSGGFPR